MQADAPLRISSEVDEEDVALVQPGQKVLIRADAFPGQIFNGRVLSITPKGDPIARSYRVRVGLDGTTPLLVGMTAETNIITRETKNALLVPAGALSSGKVWRVSDGRLQQQDVTIGAKGTDQIEITRGLSDSDEIVLAPDTTLKAGAAVRTRLKSAQ